MKWRILAACTVCTCTSWVNKLSLSLGRSSAQCWQHLKSWNAHIPVNQRDAIRWSGYTGDTGYAGSSEACKVLSSFRFCHAPDCKLWSSKLGSQHILPQIPGARHGTSSCNISTLLIHQTDWGSRVSVEVDSPISSGIVYCILPIMVFTSIRPADPVHVGSTSESLNTQIAQ